MNDTAALVRLMSWLSPVFPTGGFAYSAGLERAVHDGHVTGAETLFQWITAQVTVGALWNDAVFLAQAHNRAVNGGNVDDLSELALAMTTAVERLEETIKQGTSFRLAVGNWFGDDQLPSAGTPLPIQIGWASELGEIALNDAVAAYLHAFSSNQVQAAIRLSIIGQTGAADLLAKLEPTIVDTAERASRSTIEDLGSCTFLADIAAMKHETLQPRLFMS
ncbi:MAG: urease accessory protein UreF [Pseudomonadota bacterium]